ncbi:MAG: tRNA (N(6)-L-threonylcarbamoyladenosine(37)-C(2))-methylthiotransferase MtaB, partial [Lachnospiraceae bacterium]|nr:tRNA (N(6)-L-threonylcarbamoyladenosine(37)-C(2))-methylthiotransferase MtaB [Lachnospiraceae bacterium]
KRKGTRAAVMPNQVPSPVQTMRSNSLMELEKKQSNAFRAAYIGRETEVLFEEIKEIEGKTYMLGHTAEYLHVAKQTEKNLSNSLVKGRISGFLNEELLLME